MATQSFLVAVIGKTNGVLMAVSARTREHAERTGNAAFLDIFGEDAPATVLDTEAKTGLWLEGSSDYIRSVIA